MTASPASSESAVAPAGRQAALHRAWRTTAFIAGAFSALACALMLLQQFRQPARDPWKSPPLLALKEKLVNAPKDEQLKQEIRDLDLLLRQRYAAHLASTRRGAWMLLGGLAVFLVASRQAAAFHKKLPAPALNPHAAEAAARAARLSRWAVTVTGTAAALAFLCLAMTTGTSLPRSPAEPGKAGGRAETGAPDFASVADLRANWPRFRGWDGSGVTMHTNVLQAWGTPAGGTVAWKTPIPAPGYNSPIVWGDRVFLSGGDAKKREVFCFDAKTGALLWQKPVENVPGSPPKPPEIQEATGFAASTMATDGRRVYVMFANGDLAAFTLEGVLVWSKGLGALKNPYGHAASLATWQDKLIVQLDQGEGEAGNSKLFALDGASGRVLWQQARPVEASWATPIVVEAAGQPQILTLAKPWVIAYSATDGSEIWRLDGLEGEITPSPVFAGGSFLVVSPSVKLMALKPDGRGDVTKTHVLWSGEDGVPDVTSPVSNGELAFVITTPGIVTCYDARAGKKLWEHEFETEFHASPSLSGDRLLLVGRRDGVGIVVAAAREFKELGRSAPLGEEVHASPAFATGRLFIRGVKNLFCLGAPPEKLAKQP